jgi:hypothetical protein
MLKMTALEKYERLEATGLWRETTESQSIEVLVTFGNASLILSDFTGSPLTHWSLPAVVRTNPAKHPAIYSPNTSGAEKIEIEDEAMIEAIEEVRSSIKRRRPSPGRLRILTLLITSFFIAVLLIFWLPNILTKHTSGLVYEEQRKQIGERLIQQISKLSGPPCKLESDTNPLYQLERRLFPNSGIKILVFSEGIRTSTHLPGKFILLNRTIVEDFEVPEVVAGFAIIEKTILDLNDPMTKLLSFAGTSIVLRFLTTGKLDNNVLAEYAKYLLSKEQVMPDTKIILKEFELSNVDPKPYAYAKDITGEATSKLVNQENTIQTKRVLSKNDWLNLQAICGG